MSPIPLFVLFSLTHLVLLRSSAEEKNYNSRCAPFPCGYLGPITFPFNNKTNPECGVFTVDCSEDMPKIQLKEGGHWYQIYSISQADAIWIDDIVRPFYLDSTNSCESIRSFSLPGTSPVFFYNITKGNFSTLFNCSRSLGISKPRDFNLTSCGDYEIYYNLQNVSFPFEQQCSSIHFPLPLPEDHPHHPDKENPFSTFFTFEVHISPDCRKCHYRGGKCRADSENKFECLNEQNGSFIRGNEQKGKGREFMVKVAIAAAAAFAGIVMLVIILLCCLRKFSSNGLAFFWKKQSHAHQRIEAFLRIYGLHKVRRFSYLDVKKMTNSFKEKLGQGGFGSVYRGKLHDGSLVAVKVLKESKANGEEFINEVATISRTSHVNIVTLLGFCFEGSKKALIYEFMPNGSLEKFVFDENATEKSYQLDWETHYQISLGIARGLEYLHRGCNTRILHFDIKPHNILLDAEFVPKISDFGLAKICTRKDSLISSMLGPRGTIGYIAPEVFNRNFGGVSHKSDVYSYGMMILEMVGGRKKCQCES